MLVEKTCELWRNDGWFLSKKLLQTRGVVVIVIYMCLEPKPSIFWKIWPRKRFRSTSPPKKKGHLSPRCTISPSNRGSQLQMHKQHPWNGPYPRCGRGQEASSPRQGDKGSRRMSKAGFPHEWLTDELRAHLSRFGQRSWHGRRTWRTWLMTGLLWGQWKWRQSECHTPSPAGKPSDVAQDRLLLHWLVHSLLASNLQPSRTGAWSSKIRLLCRRMRLGLANRWGERNCSELRAETIRTRWGERNWQAEFF